MKKIVLLLALMLAGCGPSSEIKKAVEESLIDPDSAKFGEVLIGNSKKYACVIVNAKNRLGGYTGDSSVYLVKIDNKWVYVGESEAACSPETLDKLEAA